MKRSSKLDQAVEHLLNDKTFSKRTASAVVARAEIQEAFPKNRTRTWLAVAAAGLLSISIFFWNQTNSGSQRYAGLTEASSSVLASPEQTDQVWQDTDSIISGALASR